MPSGLTIVAGVDGYLDIVPNHEGFNHIALFSSASSDTPRFLTSGPWEVAGEIQGIDSKKGLMFVFFTHKSCKPIKDSLVLSL